MKVKKIAILYSGGRNFGGIEKYLIDLFTMNSRGRVQLVLLSLGKWELTERLIKGGYQVELFSGKRVNGLVIKQIADYLKEEKFDLLVSQGVVSNAYSRAVARLCKIPNLVTVHSNMVDEYPKMITRNIYKLVDKVSRFSTKRYIAVSQFLKDQLVKSGVSPERVSVIYNGVGFEKVTLRQKRRLVIGSIGRLDPIKGFDILIRSFAELKNKRLRLKIAGSGGQLKELKLLAEKLGVSDRVEFIGFVKDVNKFLDSIDIYIQSSRSEGFGLSVIEAMSRQLPIIVTPNGSLPEIINNNVTGLVSKSASPEDLAETIARMIEDYDFSKKLGEKAYDTAQSKFNKDIWFEKTLDAYLEAIE